MLGRPLSPIKLCDYGGWINVAPKFIQTWKQLSCSTKRQMMNSWPVSVMLYLVQNLTYKIWCKTKTGKQKKNIFISNIGINSVYYFSVPDWPRYFVSTLELVSKTRWELRLEALAIPDFCLKNKQKLSSLSSQCSAVLSFISLGAKVINILSVLVMLQSPNSLCCVGFS